MDLMKESESEYEVKRKERMSRNFSMLKQLNIERTKSELRATVFTEENGNRSRVGQRRMHCPTRKRRRLLTGSVVGGAAAASITPTRKSSRLRGEKPGSAGTKYLSVVADNPEAEAEAKLLTLEEYYNQNDIKTKPIQSDGTYKGWVKEEVCVRYGVAGDPDKAWEENGGGAFSFKISKADVPQHLKARGWSDARAFSSTQMLKNPNAYFYRHVAPHEAQSFGEWTDDEHNLFLETAKKYGVGNKWGLFASFIPNRVGYQCSAYYREVMIPNGFIVDPRFRMTRGGKAIFVG